MKKTVILDGPGTVRGRAKDRARLHDAVDRAFDRKAAKDVDLREICANCGSSYGVHSDSSDKCPDEEEYNGFSKTSKWKPFTRTKDGFRPRTTPAPSKKYESFLDLVKKAKEKTVAAKDADLTSVPDPQAVLDRKALHEKVKKLPIAEQKKISELSKGGTPFLDAVREVLNSNGVGDAVSARYHVRSDSEDKGSYRDEADAKSAVYRLNKKAPGKWRVEVVTSAKDSENKSVAPMVKVIPRSKRPIGKAKDASSKREALIKKAAEQGHQPATIAKFLSMDPDEVRKILGLKGKAKDSDLNPFERDTDAGAAKIVKREAKAGLSVDAIVKKYGFSKSFVEEEMPAKGKDAKVSTINLTVPDLVEKIGIGNLNERQLKIYKAWLKKYPEEKKVKTIKPVGDAGANQNDLPPKLGAAVDAWYKAAMKEMDLEEAGKARTGNKEYDAVQKLYSKSEAILSQAGYTIDSYGVYKK